MDVTLLGTGDATGVPVPTCGCEYCAESDRRRRPCVLVETADATLLLDAGPDVTETLPAAGVTDLDAAFLTHAHGDHSAGLLALGQAVKWHADHLATLDRGEVEPTPEGFDPGFAVHLTETALDNLREAAWLHDRLPVRTVAEDGTVAVGDATVTAFPVEHHRPAFQTVGFAVETGSGTLAYAPDMRALVDGPPDDVDLLVCEGAALLGRPVHGPPEELRAAVESVDAGRVVLVNVNEHLQRRHTDDLRAVAAECGYELGADFAAYGV